MPVQHEPDDTPRQEITLLAIPAALVLLWSSGFIAAFVGLLGITFGTICQKKFCAEMDPRTGYAIQFLMATILIAPLAMIFEEGPIHWTPAFFGALAYMAIFLSVISMILLTVMIRRGAISRMTSMFFLVPPMATLLGYLILGEPVGLTMLIGMAGVSNKRAV